ncbi:MAG: helix-turn-helix domain-containing protein [Bacteroidota bacterium]|nr:helix-turn-helix domain-containing protein [Bacteroidota bacterium]MDX5428663.1 helix-turn-helix domain-containing protein [Bacteroidota bacterium]MDX5447940.1 helix-turn-helix domain-containing protein [Bacteroidota bacterium]
MRELGKKVQEIRIRKGLSQEELAERAQVNVRTIQRIEANETKPRGKTIQLICSSLDISIEEIVEHGKHNDSQFMSYFHLSVLSFLIIPLGNIIFPLILWLNKKDQIIGLKETGRRLLNFQILYTILSWASILLFSFFKILHYSGSFVLFYFWIALAMLNILLAVTMAIRVKTHSKRAKYPKTIPFIS